MNLLLSRYRKSEYLLWTFYFLAFFTTSTFLYLFSTFLVSAFQSVFLYGVGGQLFRVMISTFKIIGLSYLWVLPWAILLTLFFADGRNKKLSYITMRCLEVYLRMPMVVVGIICLYLLAPVQSAWEISFIFGCIALPRIVWGWLAILKETPVLVREGALAVGFSRFHMVYHIYLKIHGWSFVQYLLKITGLLVGAVAPFVYLTSFTSFASTSFSFLPVELFANIITGHDRSPFVWAMLLVITLIILIVSMMDNKVSFKAQEESYD